MIRLQPRHVRASAALLLGLWIAACASHENAASSAVHPHWGYERAAGPSNWCELEPDYSDCCAGKEQSPIDIRPAQAVADHPAKLEFAYPSSTFSVVNNGHTVQANLEIAAPKVGLTLGGTFYDLKQFHFHTPSEHEIDGRHAPVEMHLVHQSADGTLAVVGLMIESGDANGELQKIWRLAPATEGGGGVAVGVNLANVLPSSTAHYRYPGSLTTPPCSEHVHWIVMQSPITMSAAQIEKIEGMFRGREFPDGNCRPVQPTGNRTVEIDSGP
jgi:carbonic anhydrase